MNQKTGPQTPPSDASVSTKQLCWVIIPLLCISLNKAEEGNVCSLLLQLWEKLIHKSKTRVSDSSSVFLSPPSNHIMINYINVFVMGVISLAKSRAHTIGFSSPFVHQCNNCPPSLHHGCNSGPCCTNSTRDGGNRPISSS